jgi:predicted component of type VI protein secretion system
MFDTRAMDLESQFEGLRRSEAMAPLSPQSVTELISITSALIEERRRLRQVLAQMPEDFAKVRDQLNELARALR